MADGQWGGYRAEAGGKPPGWQPSEERVDFEKERARHERVKADQREFKLAQERGEYLPRDAYRQANAVLLAMVTQALRSIPDNLERTLSLPPTVVEAVAQQIDAALAELAAGLKATTGEP